MIGKEKIGKMKKIFGIYDADHDGGLDREETKSLIQKFYAAIGYARKPTDEECFRIWAAMDTDKDGRVTFEEFASYMFGIMRMLYMRPLYEYLVACGFNPDYWLKIKFLKEFKFKLIISSSNLSLSKIISLALQTNRFKDYF